MVKLNNYITWKLLTALLIAKISIKSVAWGATVWFLGESGGSKGPNLLSSICTFSSSSPRIYFFSKLYLF